MTPREILTALFDEETVYDDPAEAADLMLSRLLSAGFVVVPTEPTGDMIRAWRRNGAPSGPKAVWRSLVTAAVASPAVSAV